MGGQSYAPAALPPGERPGTHLQVAEWDPGPVWTGAENHARAGIWSPDPPAHNEPLYRLNYPGPSERHLRNTNILYFLGINHPYPCTVHFV